MLKLKAIQWIDGSKRKWDCPHVNKCDLLIANETVIYEWHTGLPEPTQPYKYIFVRDLYPTLTDRPYTKCECPAIKEETVTEEIVPKRRRKTTEE